MPMTIMIIGAIFFVSLLILGLLIVFSNEEEPEWNREEALLITVQEQPIPASEEVTGIIEMNEAVSQLQSTTIYQPEVVHVNVDLLTC